MSLDPLLKELSIPERSLALEAGLTMGWYDVDVTPALTMHVLRLVCIRCGLLIEVPLSAEWFMHGPQARDVAEAVALTTARLRKVCPHGWPFRPSDHQDEVAKWN